MSYSCNAAIEIGYINLLHRVTTFLEKKTSNDNAIDFDNPKVNFNSLTSKSIQMLVPNCRGIKQIQFY
jgi:hypothetical protein